MSTRQHVLPTESGGQATAVGSRVRLLHITHTRYSPQWTAAPQAKSCAELFFILGGHGSFHIHQDTFPAALNDLVVINAGIPHAQTSQSEGPMEYLALGVTGLENVSSVTGYSLFHLAAGSGGVSDCLRMFLQELEDEPPECDLVCQLLLNVVLLRLCRLENFARSASSSARPNRECELVRQYIESHFDENLRLDQLADLVHVNKYYLAHTFRREFNTSPISYLNARRIQESRYLLSETDQTLSQIARSLGFSSPSYFSQSFRRQEGISPLEYRKRCRKGRASGV